MARDPGMDARLRVNGAAPARDDVDVDLVGREGFRMVLHAGTAPEIAENDRGDAHKVLRSHEEPTIPRLRLLIAVGPTAGHVYPALAIAQADTEIGGIAGASNGTIHVKINGPIISRAGGAPVAWEAGSVGIRLLKEYDGANLGFGRALGRRLLHVLDSLVCYIGWLMPLWDAKRQTFADKMVHTVVVRDNS